MSRVCSVCRACDHVSDSSNREAYTTLAPSQYCDITSRHINITSLARHSTPGTMALLFCFCRFGFYVICTLHGHAVDGHTILACPRRSAQSQRSPRLSQAFHDEARKCRRLFIMFPAVAYRACTEACRQARCPWHQLLSPVGFSGRISLQGYDDTQWEASWGLSITYMLVARVYIRRGGFLRSVDLYAPSACPANTADLTAPWGLLIHL